MPFTPPSIYAPGTVDLLSLIMQAKSGTAGLHKALTGQSSPLDMLGLGEGSNTNSGPANAAGTGTAQSATVGNAAIGAIGNALLGAVIGPIGTAALGLAGIAPPSAISQVMAALGMGPNASAPDIGTIGAGISQGNQDDADNAAAAASESGTSASADSGSTSSDSGSGSSGDSGASSGDSGSASGTGTGTGTGTGDYAKGGIIKGKGTSTSDSISIKASDGEYMLPAHVVEAIGKPFLDHLVSSIPNVLDGNQGEGK